MIDEGEVVKGAVGVAAACGGREDARTLLSELRSLAAMVSPLARQSRVWARATRSGGSLTAVIQKAGEYRTLHEFAFAVTNNLRGRLDCQQTSLGVVRGGKVRLLSISGLDEVKHRSPGVHRMVQAMEECVDLGEPIASPVRGEGGMGFGAGRMRLHEQWRAQAGDAAVLSVPLFSGERVSAVMSVRRPVERPFTEEEIGAVAEAVGPVGAALPMVEKSTRTALGKAGRDAGAAVRWLVSPGSWGGKVFLAGLAGLVLWASLGTMGYRVSVPASVVASDLRTVGAPFEGRIAESFVERGEAVEAGDPLVRMETRELELEADRLRSEMAVLRIEIDQAVSSGELSAARLADARLELAEARLRVVESRMSSAVVRSPVSGVVLEGTPEKRVGEVAPLGEALVSVAAGGGRRLELLVPERRAVDVSAGSAVRFASHAAPEKPGEAVVQRVSPSSEVREGRAVFVAEAGLGADALQSEWARAGMEGVGHIEAGDRRVWWIVLNRAIDAVRLRWWGGS